MGSYSFVTLGLGSNGCQYSNINILLQLQIDKASDKVLHSDNYQVNLTAIIGTEGER